MRTLSYGAELAKDHKDIIGEKEAFAALLFLEDYSEKKAPDKDKAEDWVDQLKKLTMDSMD